MAFKNWNEVRWVSKDELVEGVVDPASYTEAELETHPDTRQLYDVWENTKHVNDSLNALVSVLPGQINAGVLSFFTGGNQSLATDGYQIFAGGLMLQWVKGPYQSFSAIEEPLDITFPIPFSSSVFIVLVATDIDVETNQIYWSNVEWQVYRFSTNTTRFKTSVCMQKHDSTGAGQSRALVLAIGV